MNEKFTLADERARSDLSVYVGRANQVDQEGLRLSVAGGVLAAYAPVIYARGLLDRAPTILGLRTFAETSGASFDRVVVPRAISDRLARLQEPTDLTVQMPPDDVRAAWAGIAPPRGGWERTADIAPDLLRSEAERGAKEIADALPTDAGDPVVQRVRSHVWGTPIEDAGGVPAGAAFAAESLGFIGSDPFAVFRSGSWTRLTSHRGHVLVRVGPGSA